MNGPVRRNHRKTCRRFNDAGHAHELTFSCFKRQPLLDKNRSRLWMIDAIARARELHRFHLWAYVIMPEHVHLLLWPTRDNYSISEILKSLKQSVSRKAILFLRHSAPRYLGRLEDRQPNGTVSHRFWQRGGGYDRNLTEATTVWATIDYLHANPVRRGLCERPIDWEWSSAREYNAPGSGRLTIDQESLPRTEAG